MVQSTVIPLAAFIRCAVFFAALLLLCGTRPAAAQRSADQGNPVPMNSTDDCDSPVLGSPFIPVDSWIYPAVMRLYSMGFVDSVYLGMRPWTRSNLRNMLDEANSHIDDEDPGAINREATRLVEALTRELRNDPQDPCVQHGRGSRLESTYTAFRGIGGTPLRDSYHLGSTIVNDYGRPYANGVSSYSGASGYAFAGRFLLYARGEFQGAPSAAGYSSALAQALSTVDGTTYTNPAGAPYAQATIPAGPIAASTNGRFLEAYLSVRYLNHEISLGKQDDWLGPGMGGGMAYSNNAENIYSFHINRVEPLTVPLLSNLTGPFRYEFLVGSLRGHTYMPSVTPGVAGTPNVVNPGDPWVHVEKISFRPDRNLEFGFERTVIWGGKGHEPITLHTFLRSFFSLANVTNAVKYGAQDPGARFGAFDFSYRLPFVRNWLLLYADSEVHDDVSPIDAPRRAAWRPGLYLSHFPGIPRLDLRVEAASTDPPVSRSTGGAFMYYETIQKQGYTNKGALFGDWIGREDKGGQGWLTYHLSGNEWIQIGVRTQKAAKDFIPGATTVIPGTSTFTTPGGTTLSDIDVEVVKRIKKDLEIRGAFAYERWKAPIYLPGLQTVTTTTVHITWFPERKVAF